MSEQEPVPVVFKIEAVHAFVAVGPDGEEGIIGMMMPDGGWMPMIAADRTRLEQLLPAAREQAVALERQTGHKVKLVRFTTREELYNV